MTLEQARELEIKRARERKRQAAQLAAQGRGEDTEIAHVARGEVVVPEALQTPELLAALRHAAKARGIPFERLRVGSAHNSINPKIGVAEFAPYVVPGGPMEGITVTAPPLSPRFELPVLPMERPGPTQEEMTGYDASDPPRVYPGPIDPGLLVKGSKPGAWDLTRNLLRPEVETLLDDIISPAEGATYNTRFGGSSFDLYGGHPGALPRPLDANGNPIGQKYSPAGFVQMTESTWNEVADRYGLDKANYGAFNQRLGAVGRIIDRQALDPLLNGDLDTVIRLLKPEWASLPGDGQRISADDFKQRFADGMAKRAR